MTRSAYTWGVRLLASCVLAAVTLGYAASRKPSMSAAAVEEAEAALAAIAAKHGTDSQTLLGAVVEHRLADRILSHAFEMASGLRGVGQGQPSRARTTSSASRVPRPRRISSR